MNQLHKGQAWSSELDDVLRARLHEVTADVPMPPGLQQAAISRGKSRLSRRRFLRVAAAAAASTLVVAAVALRAEPNHRPPSGPLLLTPAMLKFSTTPQLGGSAAQWLEATASRVAALASTGSVGRYAYVRTESWNLSTSVSEGVASSRIVPERREQWIANDGSGRIKITTIGQGSQRQPGSDESFPAGGLSLSWPIGSLPSDKASLERVLRADHPDDNGPAERLIAIADAYRQLPIDPPARAAMLTYLAETRGLTLRGNVTDRLGRPGVGLSVDSDFAGLPTRYTLIFDASDGRLLGYEEMLTTSPGALNVKIPAVISYTIFDEATLRKSTH
jgi:hypothetical protein